LFLRLFCERIADAATIPYRGSLTDQDGHPVPDGRYDFTFTLYAGEDLTSPLWSEEQLAVNLVAGDFSVQLGGVQPLPADLARTEGISLLVAVRGPGEAEYTSLHPPQVLDPVQGPATRSSPAGIDSGPACAHDHLGEVWEGAYDWGLVVRNTNATGPGVSGVANSAGVVGSDGTIASHVGQVIGVLGSSVAPTGIGVVGNYFGTGTGYAGRFHDIQNDYRDLQLGGNIGRIYANDNSGSALWFTSNADIWLILDNDDGGSNSLKVKSGGDDVCTIDEGGNLHCIGNITSGAGTAQHGQRSIYALGSTEVLVEDIGSGTLENGEAYVAFEPVFAETVNLSVNYQVTLTPVCSQPILLSVSAKKQGGFNVLGVTLDGGPSDCGFDYRVSAKRLGYEDQRLAPVPLVESEAGDG